MRARVFLPLLDSLRLPHVARGSDSAVLLPCPETLVPPASDRRRKGETGGDKSCFRIAAFLLKGNNNPRQTDFYVVEILYRGCFLLKKHERNNL